MSSTQLQDELERSFGDGPEPRPVGSQLEAGRRALRRRRVSAAALGTVLVLGAGYAAVAGIGPSEPTTGEVVTEPTPSPTMRPSRGIGWDQGPVRYRDGVLEVHPAAVVHERIDNPFDAPAREELPTEERSALFAALHELPEMQRKVAVLRHWLGLSVAETAAELRISEGTVKSHSSRALDRLQKVLTSPTSQ